MKKLLHHLAFWVMAAVCVFPGLLRAQAPDTLSVAALPAGNLNTVINGDTLAGGFRAHPFRAYRLRHGSAYQLTEPIKVYGNLTIIANDTIAGLRPPVLAPAILPDNSSIDNFIDLRGKGSKVTLQDLYLVSIRSDKAYLGWSEGVRVNADSITLKLRRVVFDAFTSCALRVYASWSKMDVQSCTFRNLMHSSSYFGGQAYLSDFDNHMDTCKFVNNTFFACNSYIWSIRGYDKYSLFEHNTVVYGVVNPFLTRQTKNLHIKNNVFYASHAYGGIPDHVINGWFLNYPDTVSSSIINVRSKGTYGPFTVAGIDAYVDSAKGVTMGMLSEASRTTDIRNNAYFFPAALYAGYKAYNDTVLTKDSVDLPSGGKGQFVRKLILPRWINDYSQYSLDSVLSKIAPSTTTVTGNQSADPGFNATINGHFSKLMSYIYKIATNKLDSIWNYNPTGVVYPPVWPLPENLTYSNVSMQSAGTDGKALGDLNWFPGQMTSVEDKQVGTVPKEYSLEQNYPNPFNPSTKIEFAIPAQSEVSLKVYNVLGQEVATLVNESIKAGHHVVNFDASGLASGMYFYKVVAGSFVSTRKMLLLK